MPDIAVAVFHSFLILCMPKRYRYRSGLPQAGLHAREAAVRLQLAKWGNCLAIRLPRECTRAAGLHEGDYVEAIIAQEGTITLMPDKAFKKAAFLSRLGKLYASMKMTKPVVEKMRQEARY